MPNYPSTSPGLALELQEVSKRFGRNRVLDQVSFEVRPGRVSAILGPNAAGKSTAMKIVLGLVRPDSGRVLVNGIPAGGRPRVPIQYRVYASKRPLPR